MKAGSSRREQRDHRATGFVDDLLDQLKRVLRWFAEPDEGDVGMLSRRRRADVADWVSTRDHLVPEGGDDLGEQGQSIASLVGDEYAKRRDLALSCHIPRSPADQRSTASSKLDPCHSTMRLPGMIGSPLRFHFLQFLYITPPGE